MNWHYLYVFFQSNGLEVLFLLGFYRFYQARDRLGGGDIALKVTLANTLTHPIVLFLILKGPFTYFWAIVIAESFAVLGETWLHQRYLNISWKKAFLGSLLANLISWQMGPILTTLIFLRDRV
jgi:hypothetical protein